MIKRHLRALGIFVMTVLWASACCAGGGKVSYPDGQPVVGAAVRVFLQDVDKYELTTNADGRFTLPTMEFLDAFVQI
jgi:hypothetical protein